ncbi:MAG: hypothetical protein IIW34_06700 [Clostridia bacterium]|nr:hypothetical protein [Clostridia bacterium]
MKKKEVTGQKTFGTDLCFGMWNLYYYVDEYIHDEYIHIVMKGGVLL